MLELIGLGITAATALAGFAGARSFVRDRLRFVDAVQRRAAPWIAGILAAVIAAPVVALLPLVGIGTAIIFGASVAIGVATGARDIRTGTSGYLTSGGTE
jgi:hypothetical protein